MNDVMITSQGGLTARDGVLPPTTPNAIAQIRQMEEIIATLPQIELTTNHVIHAGIYSRTICIPAGAALTSVLIKIPTTLVVCGKCSVLIGDAQEVMLDGYHVFAASAGRKQAYIAHADTFVTMSFKTNARTVEEAEQEFTDEAGILMSRHGVNEVVVTGD